MKTKHKPITNKPNEVNMKKRKLPCWQDRDKPDEVKKLIRTYFDVSSDLEYLEARIKELKVKCGSCGKVLNGKIEMATVTSLYCSKKCFETKEGKIKLV